MWSTWAFFRFCPALTKLALDLHVNFCLFVLCLFVRLSGLFFKASNWMIYWLLTVVLTVWHPIYPTRCLELGWAVPHSDFLAWLSSTTLKNLSQVFQIGFSCGKKQVWSTHRVDWEDDLKMKTTSKIKMTSKMKTTSTMKITLTMKTNPKMETC